MESDQVFGDGAHLPKILRIVNYQMTPALGGSEWVLVRILLTKTNVCMFLLKPFAFNGRGDYCEKNPQPWLGWLAG